ncbi:MAG: lysophospholipase [Oscillospiraceae bacterium]|nr:lysophospholipase [Oscillospiraceae bacterium]
MAQFREFFFPGTDGISQIHAVEWLPDSGEVKAVLQIAHGIAEYAERYAPFAEYLTAQSFAVVANDHMGHGKSHAEGQNPLYFGAENGWENAVDDMYTLHSLTHKTHPDVPYFLMGHSMGSFLARTFLIRYPGVLSGSIVMGTGQTPAAIAAAGRAVAKLQAKKVGWDNYSPAVNNLAFGSYNKAFAPNRTEFDWLSINEENVDRYIADPLCGGGASVGLFHDMLGGISFIGKQSNVEKMNIHTPILFISGGKDPVGDMGKGVQKAYASFRKAGVRDLQLKIYPELRHEILNEACRDEVYEDILAWLKAHME